MAVDDATGLLVSLLLAGCVLAPDPAPRRLRAVFKRVFTLYCPKPDPALSCRGEVDDAAPESGASE